MVELSDSFKEVENSGETDIIFYDIEGFFRVPEDFGLAEQIGGGIEFLWS